MSAGVPGRRCCPRPVADMAPQAGVQSEERLHRTSGGIGRSTALVRVMTMPALCSDCGAIVVPPLGEAEHKKALLSQGGLVSNTFTASHGSIDVAYECEECGEKDEYSYQLLGEYTDQRANYSGPLIAAENHATAIEALEEKKRVALATCEGISVRKCPNCGRYQSWMSASLKSDRFQSGVIIVFAIAAVPLAVAVFQSQQDNQWFAALVFLVVYGGVASLLGSIASGVFDAVVNGKRTAIGDLEKPPTVVWRSGE